MRESLFGSPQTATLEELSGEPLSIILNMPHSYCVSVSNAIPLLWGYSRNR